jgi:hypothetical protein
MAFLTQNKAKLCKILITLVFEKNAKFFAENCRKSQKIAIITSTPGCDSFQIPTYIEVTTLILFFIRKMNLKLILIVDHECAYVTFFFCQNFR